MLKDKVMVARECGKIPGDEYESEAPTPKPLKVELVSIGLYSTTLEDLIISDLSHCSSLQH